MPQRTPLHSFHTKHGASFVDFAGWEMPIVYKRDGQGSLVDEHKQTRASGGIFDVSHMGRFGVKGVHAGRLLERLCTRRVRDMKPGQCRYSMVCNERGGIMDDVIVYRIDEDDFLVVVNASNREKLWKHFNDVKIAEQLKANLDDRTLSTAMIAVQGPRVMDMISKFSKEIPSLKRYTFAVKNLMVVKLIVSRTGYTGEDGVEVILPAAMVDLALKLLLKDMNVEDPNTPVKPCGLGARDTLRLEAGMPLYGHELGEETCALATGLDFAIAMDKDTDPVNPVSFIGQDALKKIRDAGGPAEKLVGFVLEGPRSARQGMSIIINDKPCGKVTSGAPCPTVGASIGMGYVPKEHAAPGTLVQIDTGKGLLTGKIVPLPFYKAPKKA